MNDSIRHVSKNVRLVGLCTIGSRILGLVRDQAMSALFGAGPLMDAFTVAFRLPNLARVLLGEGALTTAFLPVFLEDLRERGRESASQVTWAVFFTLATLLCGLIVIAEGILFAIGLAFELGPEATLLRDLTAILLPYVLLICLAAQLGAVLNALGKFIWPALIPSILNATWLCALLIINQFIENDRNRIIATAVCVVIGGVFQLLVPMIVVQSTGFGLRSDWFAAIGRVKKVAGDMLPVVIGLSITQMNTVLDSFIAWGFTQPKGATEHMPFWPFLEYPLREGTATALYLGQRLYQFPLGVFGVALGTVLFPLLTSHAQRGESQKLREDLSFGVRLIVAIGIPASIGLMLMGHPMATVFFQYGKFNADDARMTGDMIIAYGSGVWAYCALLILQRGFYAIGDRLTPMYVGLVAMISNLVLNLLLIWPLGGRGLALSTAFIAACQCVVTGLLLQHRIGRLLWNEIGRTLIKTAVSVAVMSAAIYATNQFLPAQDVSISRLVRLSAPLLIGGATFLLSAKVLGLAEPWLLVRSKSSLQTSE